LTGANKDSQLRKTQSQPHPVKGANSDSSAGKGKVRQDSQKHVRCKSVTAPTEDGAGGAETKSVQEQTALLQSRKSSCPNSPVEISKDVGQEKNKGCTPGAAGSMGSNSATSASAGGSDSSPKPKKTIFEGFRSQLRKSKSDSPGGIPDVVQENDTRTTGSSSPLSTVSSSLSGAGEVAGGQGHTWAGTSPQSTSDHADIADQSPVSLRQNSNSISPS
jgi:hypothetical protein